MSAPREEPGEERPGAPRAASEDIHLPGSTYLPVVVAAGITLALVGILVNVVIVVLGMAIWLIATAMWIRDTRGEIAELPIDRG